MKRKFVYLAALATILTGASAVNKNYNVVDVENKTYYSEASEASGFTNEALYNCIVDQIKSQPLNNYDGTSPLTEEQLNKVSYLSCGNLTDFTDIEKLPSLKTLDLFGQSDLTDIDKLKSLKNICITNYNGDELDLSKLNLKEIMIYSSKIKKVILPETNSLNKLDLEYNTIDTIDFNNNESVNDLRFYSNDINKIENINYDNEYSITLDDLDYLEKMFDLSKLKVSKLYSNTWVNIKTFNNKITKEEALSIIPDNIIFNTYDISYYKDSKTYTNEEIDAIPYGTHEIIISGNFGESEKEGNEVIFKVFNHEYKGIYYLEINIEWFKIDLDYTVDEENKIITLTNNHIDDLTEDMISIVSYNTYEYKIEADKISFINGEKALYTYTLKSKLDNIDEIASNDKYTVTDDTIDISGESINDVIASINSSSDKVTAVLEDNKLVVTNDAGVTKTYTITNDNIDSAITKSEYAIKDNKIEILDESNDTIISKIESSSENITAKIEDNKLIVTDEDGITKEYELQRVTNPKTGIKQVSIISIISLLVCTISVFFVKNKSKFRKNI